MAEFSFYPAILSLSTKTEFYGSMFKTSLDFEDQHMLLNVLKKTDYETKLLLRCALDVTARNDYEFGWKLKLTFFFGKSPKS